MLVHLITPEEIKLVEDSFKDLSLLESEMQLHLKELESIPRHKNSFESMIIEKETLRLSVIKKSLDKLAKILNTEKFNITNE